MILMMEDVTPNEWGGNPVEGARSLPPEFFTVKCRIDLNGVTLFDIHFWHPQMSNQLMNVVEVTYQAKNYSMVEVKLQKGAVIAFSRQISKDLTEESKQQLTQTFEMVLRDWRKDEFAELENSFDLIEAKAVILKLETACNLALTLRGITAAINDPLILDGEKQALRERYLKIENQMRTAVADGTNFRTRGK